jgi:hypothetical protein
MRLISGLVAFFVLTGLSSACSAQSFDNPFSEYLERGITITPGAGNAKDANAAIHTIDPWPPYVGYTRIPGDGRRAVNSIEQMYRNPNPFQSQQPSLGTGSPSFGATPVTGAGTTTNSGGSPMQPISGGY